MNKLLYILILIAATASIASAQSRLKLGHFEDTENECGCSLARNTSNLRNHRVIFRGFFDETAQMNINGRRVKLRLSNASDEAHAFEVGDRSWETYAAPGVRVRVDFVISGVCPPSSENCEVTFYNAMITVRQRGRKIVVRTIGICGC
jgi:hypothetical protein